MPSDTHFHREWEPLVVVSLPPKGRVPTLPKP
jgi:hypothetical protein